MNSYNLTRDADSIIWSTYHALLVEVETVGPIS